MVWTLAEAAIVLSKTSACLKLRSLNLSRLLKLGYSVAMNTVFHTLASAEDINSFKNKVQSAIDLMFKQRNGGA